MDTLNPKPIYSNNRKVLKDDNLGKTFTGSTKRVESLNLESGMRKEYYNTKVLNPSTTQVSSWLEKAQVDHKIPIVLGGKDSDLLKRLNDVKNMQLLHSDCHKEKTNRERGLLLTLYRKTRKEYLERNIKDSSELELQIATYSVFIRLYEEGSLTKAMKLEVEDEARLKTIYNIARRKLLKLNKSIKST